MATNKITGMSYIGQTVDFKNRKSRHIKDAFRQREKDTSVFHKSILIHGAESFDWKILEECSKDKLDDRERYWIQYYDTYNNGYNMTLGGENADCLLAWKEANPEKVLAQNMQNVQKMIQWNREHPEESAKNLALGAEWHKTHKEEMREVGLRSIQYAHQWQKEHPEEFAKILQNNIKKAQESHKIPVKCIELDLIFDSMNDAEKWSLSKENPNGKRSNHRHISLVCRGKRQTTGGYHWEYANK